MVFFRCCCCCWVAILFVGILTCVGGVGVELGWVAIVLWVEVGVVR
jgi:hypothetical protein